MTYKNYVNDGDYTVKCDGVEIKEVGQNGSVVMKFHFVETEEEKFPTADHWLSFKNADWRQKHNRKLMKVLGASEENADKAVEIIEKATEKKDIMDGYQKAYDKLLAKTPGVKIEVYTKTSGYPGAEFKDRSVAMPHESGGKRPETEQESPLEGAEKVDIADIPF